MTFIDLFAGIGGFSLGLTRAGMTCVGQVELDPYCLKVLAKHWPDVPRHENIHTFRGDEFGTADLICAGVPCQPHSHAGRRQGARDPRDLWPEFMRVVRYAKPRWVLVENVYGFLSTDSGRFFAGVLRDLAACGYDARWECLPAAAFGAPHIRDRVMNYHAPSLSALGVVSWVIIPKLKGLAPQGCEVPTSEPVPNSLPAQASITWAAATSLGNSQPHAHECQRVERSFLC